MDALEPRARALAGVSRAAGALAIVVGCLVLIGWVFDVARLKSVLPGLVTMTANTAVGFVLAGVSLLLWHAQAVRAAKLRPIAARYAAFGVALSAIGVGSVTLVEILFGWNAGIDDLVFRDLAGELDPAPPRRMSSATALGLVLIGGSLALLAIESKFAAGTAQLLAAAAAAIAVIVLLGYLLDQAELYHVRAFAMALHSAFALFAIAAGVITALPARGWVRDLVAETRSARTGRRLLISLFVLLPALGWLGIQGTRAGWYGPTFDLGEMIVASLLVIAALVWVSTRWANRAEERIRRLNRTYALLSKVNALIVRARDRRELFEGSCRIAVEAGDFPCVWLGTIDRAAMRVVPAAWAGKECDFLEKAGEWFSIRDDSGTRGPVAEAVLGKKPAISNDVRTDASNPLGSDLLEHGIRSVAIVPLLAGGEVVGVLALHAEASGFFDVEEVKLFMELAGDVTFALDHLEKEQRLNHFAYYDTLTDLANRTLFLNRVAQHVNGAERSQGRLALIVFDVARFRMINDAHGRNIGDELLREIGKRLERRAVDPGHVARVGSDQFAAVVPDVRIESEIARDCERLVLECFDPPFTVGGEEFRLSIRAGIAIYPRDGVDADTLFNNAEAALKRAKTAGEKYLFYAPQINERVAETLRLETQLRRALEKDQFVLHYQPKVGIESRELRGVEALIRWQSSERGLVPPASFVPLMEETGLVLEVGTWVIRQAIRDQRRFDELGVSAPRIAVNVSAVQLRQHDFLHTVEAALAQDASPRGLDLEITESVIMEDIEATIDKLQAIGNLGVSITIDDFGTGYSSLAYLAKLPVQRLKIDRSFILTLPSEPQTATLVSTIISMAHSLGLKVVAEGVETEEQAAMLRALNCDEMQGYLVSEPLPFEEMVTFIRRTAT